LNIRVAVIGPDDLVQKVQSLQGEFPALTLLSFPYQMEDEAPVIFRLAAIQAEAVVFTGPVPYYITRQEGVSPLPLQYIPLTGSSLMRTIFELRETPEVDPRCGISLDTVKGKTARETMTELGLTGVPLYIKEFEDLVSADELVAFHHDLAVQGRTAAALTCLRSAHLKLKALGVTSFWVVPTYSGIRDTLQMVLLQVEQLRSKETQIAVQVCDIDGYADLVKRAPSDYYGNRIRLILHNILNDYAERTWASVQASSADRFTIITTRGILEKVTDGYQSDPLLGEIRKQLPAKVSIGTGFGATAYHAQKSAQQALARAKAAGGDCSYVLTDQGKLLGPLGREPRLEARVLAQDERLLNVAKRAGLSYTTISKIVSTLDLLGKSTLTSPELALGLQISSRNARRILNQLAAAGMAESSGKEYALPSGRPRRVYRIHLEVLRT